MEFKQEFVLKKMMGDTLLVPLVNENSNFNGVITLNDTAAFIVSKLKELDSVDDVVKSITDEYDVDSEYAKKCTLNLINQLKDIGLLR